MSDKKKTYTRKECCFITALQNMVDSFEAQRYVSIELAPQHIQPVLKRTFFCYHRLEYPPRDEFPSDMDEMLKMSAKLLVYLPDMKSFVVFYVTTSARFSTQGPNSEDASIALRIPYEQLAKKLNVQPQEVVQFFTSESKKGKFSCERNAALIRSMSQEIGLQNPNDLLLVLLRTTTDNWNEMRYFETQAQFGEEEEKTEPEPKKRKSK